MLKLSASFSIERREESLFQVAHFVVWGVQLGVCFLFSTSGFIILLFSSNSLASAFKCQWIQGEVQQARPLVVQGEGRVAQEHYSNSRHRSY